MASQWLPVAEAARALGVSDRTVKRRIEAGEIESKLENLPRGGVRRLVLMEDREGHERDKTERDVQDTKRTAERATLKRKGEAERDVQDNRAGRARQAERDTSGAEREVEVLRDALAHEREQNAFFRATIEQHQRSEAELRQSLREALRAMPKAITAGEGATIAENKPQNGAAGGSGPSASNGPESGGNRGEAGISYASIADELERMMNQ